VLSLLIQYKPSDSAARKAADRRVLLNS